MDLANLYRLFARRAAASGEVRNFPSWDDIAEAARVNPLDDAAAVRALIEKGALRRIPLGPGTFSDYRYQVVVPRPDAVAGFEHALRTIGASCTPFV